MKRPIIFAALLLTFIACNRIVVSVDTTLDTAMTAGVNPAFTDYVSRFYKDANRLNPNVKPRFVPINFVKSLGDSVVGICYTVGVFHWIVVDRDYWYNSDDLQRELLIYHELGHCVLDRGHSEFGIMEPELISPYFYKDHKESLKYELFTGVVDE